MCMMEFTQSKEQETICPYCQESNNYYIGRSKTFLFVLCGNCSRPYLVRHEIEHGQVDGIIQTIIKWVPLRVEGVGVKVESMGPKSSTAPDLFSQNQERIEGIINYNENNKASVPLLNEVLNLLGYEIHEHEDSHYKGDFFIIEENQA